MHFPKLRLIHFFYGLILLLMVMTVQSCFESNHLPQQVRLVPGQSLSLKVHYPLSFYAPKTSQLRLSPLEITPVKVLTTSKLLVHSRAEQRFAVQLRLFNLIPVKEMQVKITAPPLVVPGGQAIGVLFSSQGVLIVGHLPIKGVDFKTYYPAKEAGLQAGDLLLAIDNHQVNRVDEVESLLKGLKIVKRPLSLLIKRHNQLKILRIKPVLTSKINQPAEQYYKLGIFIEDPAAGIGTLTFYDPISRRFAGLGHRIADFAGKKEIPFQTGEIVLAQISAVRQGVSGQPGEKIGLFNSNLNSIGKIVKNCRFGIYGQLEPSFIDTRSIQPIPVAYATQAKTGPAVIYTVLKGSKVETFQAMILKVYHQEAPHDKGMVIKIIDPVLRRETGGIIQGMSGSPIVQAGKLVGAVTHVFVNDPTKGYGILAEWMMEEMNHPNK